MTFLPSFFTVHVSSAVASRGRSYRNRVRIMKKKPGYIEAYVFGTQRYTASIAKNGESTYTDSCTCPYRATCKHTIALAYVIESASDIKAILEQGNHETAVDDFTKFEDDPELTEFTKTIHEYRQVHTVAPPPKPTTLDIIRAISTPDAPLPKPKKDICVYYVLHARVADSWETHSGETTLEIEAGKAERPWGTPDYFFNEPQDIRSMKGKNAAYLTDLDRDILSLLSQGYQMSPQTGYWNAMPIENTIIQPLLLLLKKAPLLFYHDGKIRHPLTMTDTPRTIHMQLIIDETGGHLTSDISSPAALCDYHPPILITTDYVLSPLDTALSAHHIIDLMTSPPIPKNLLKEPDTISSLLTASQTLPIALPQAWLTNTKTIDPVAVVTLRTSANPWMVDLSFSYDGVSISADHTHEYIALNDPKVPIGKRNRAKEEAYLTKLSAIIGSKPISAARYEIPALNEQLFIEDILPAFPADWELYIEDSKRTRVSRTPVSWNIQAKSTIDWLDISGSVAIDQETITLTDMLDTIFHGQRLVRINDRFHLLPDTLMSALNKLKPLRQDTGIKLHRLHIGLLDGLEEIIPYKTLHKEWQNTLLAARSFGGIPDRVPIPKTIRVRLREYQLHGVAFLSYLREFKFGGLLADDMGLGKTLQAIVALSSVHTKPNGISMVVTPTSVVGNWLSECKAFAPHLRVHKYTGKNRTLPKKDAADIFLTSYALLWRDRNKLKTIPFTYIILDESQYIKNADTETAKAVISMQAKHRLSLTGTPVENSMTELYSQFAFLNPGMFGSIKQFRERFTTPVELKKLITPFILRRTKDQVLKDLPAKTEQTLRLEMDEKQRILYQTVKSHFQAKVMRLVNTKGIEKSQIQILEALLRLRQVCCDPQLLPIAESEIPLPQHLKSAGSVKRDETIRMLKEAVQSGHNVLLFSQFTSMLDILVRACEQEEIPYRLLTGKTKNRDQIIQQFQTNRNPTVFLLSLKAGGTGLNLTAADYVIHYDPWWNPAVEQQATDRAHRIGQTKSVTVYKLIINDTIEEKIQKLQEAKKGLINDLITSGTSKRITKEDLLYLFS